MCLIKPGNQAELTHTHTHIFRTKKEKTEQESKDIPEIERKEKKETIVDFISIAPDLNRTTTAK